MSQPIALLLFVALVLGAALHGLTASGHFPVRQKAAVIGTPVLFGSIAVTIVAFLSGLAAALRDIPWYAAVIGGGLALLAAPLALQCFPDRFVDGRGALLVFSGGVAAMALLLAGLAIGA